MGCHYNDDMNHAKFRRLLLTLLAGSLVLLLDSCASTPVATAPQWYTDLASAYPEDQYLAVVGSGPDLETARHHAQGQLANFFGMTVTAITSGKVEYADKGKASTAESQLSRSVSETVRTESNQKLYAVKYSESYTLKNTTYLAAWLVIKDSLAQIKAEKKSMTDACGHYLAVAAKDGSTLDRYLNLLAGTALLGRISELDNLLRALKAPPGNELFSLQEQSRSLSDTIKSRMSATIDLDDPNDMAGNVLNEALTSLDIKPSATGSLKVKAVISVKPLNLASVSNLHTHEWLISLSLIDENGTTWFADQASNRASGSSDDTAKLRARMEIEKFIKTEFTKTLLAKFLAKLS